MRGVRDVPFPDQLLSAAAVREGVGVGDVHGTIDFETSVGVTKASGESGGVFNPFMAFPARPELRSSVVASFSGPMDRQLLAVPCEPNKF